MNFLFERRGQIGKILTSLPVLFILLFLLGIFLVLSTFAARSFATVPDAVGVWERDVLLKEINVNGEKMLLIDGLIKLEHGRIGRDVLNEEIKKFVNEKNNALLLAKGESEEPGRLTGGAGRNNFIVFYDNGVYSPNLGSFSSHFAEYRNKGLLKGTFFEVRTGGIVKKIYIEYYYGRKYE